MTQTPEKSVADILADAREYLEKHEWVRGMIAENGIDENNRRQVVGVCAVGAICYSQGWLDIKKPMLEREHVRENQKVQAALYKVLGDLPESDEYDCVAEWNDYVAEDKQQVLDLFAKAEKIERAGFDPDA